MQTINIRKNGLGAILRFPSFDGDYIRISAASFTGIPTTNTTTASTKLLTSFGYGVIQPQYIGTYDSDGILTPENCVKTISKAFYLDDQNKFIFDYHSNKQSKLSSKSDILMAHCVGGCFSLNAILRGFRPHVVILFAPICEYGPNRRDAGTDIDFVKYVKYMKNVYTHTHRFDSQLWENFFLHDSNFHPLPGECAISEKKSKLLVLMGDQDEMVDVHRCKNFIEHFAKKYSHVLELSEFVCVPQAKHNVQSILSPSTIEFINNWLILHS
jgi:hypothetical protein